MLPYARAFEKYLGRPLRKWEAEVIAPIERMRQRGYQRRIIIRDRPPRDSRHILVQYIRYCTTVTGHKAYIAAPSLLAARNLTDYTAADQGTIYLGSYTRPDRCRGIDITFALLLDADEASYRHLMATYRALSGTVNTLQSPDPFIIVHTINIEPVWAFIPYIKTCNPSVPALPAPPPSTPPPIPPEPKPPELPPPIPPPSSPESPPQFQSPFPPGR